MEKISFLIFTLLFPLFTQAGHKGQDYNQTQRVITLDNIDDILNLAPHSESEYSSVSLQENTFALENNEDIFELDSSDEAQFEDIVLGPAVRAAAIARAKYLAKKAAQEAAKKEKEAIDAATKYKKDKNMRVADDLESDIMRKHRPGTFYDPEQEYLKQLIRREMSKPSASHTELREAIEELWRAEPFEEGNLGVTKHNPNVVGNGSTATAVRYERATGKEVGGCNHSQKAQDQLNRLSRIRGNLRNQWNKPGWGMFWSTLTGHFSKLIFIFNRRYVFIRRMQSF